MPTDSRDLSDDERALLVRLLQDRAFVGADSLLEQAGSARVVGGLPTLLDLEVANTAPRADVADGPAPLRAFVEATSGEVEGEVLVWVNGGYLSGLEFAWYSDSPPSGMPRAEQLRFD